MLTFQGENNLILGVGIPILDDSAVEPAENFSVTISGVAVPSRVRLDPTSGVNTIQDDDLPPRTFTQLDPTTTASMFMRL